MDNPQPSTSHGKQQTMEAIKTSQNPYYCGDNVELGQNVSGNTKSDPR